MSKPAKTTPASTGTEEPEKKSVQSVADLGDVRAKYFSEVRTDAYININEVRQYIEFWAALRVDSEKDEWRIMRYMIFDLDQPDGRFIAEVANKSDVPFTEALRILARNDTIAQGYLSHEAVDLQKKYPEEQFPELSMYFYEIEHYKKAAKIEGVDFDDKNNPHLRLRGRIFTSGRFKRSDIVSSIKADDTEVKVPLMEAGVLSDLFNTATSKGASLDAILNVTQALNTLDRFAVQIGAFYLAAQKCHGLQASYSQITDMADAEKKTVFEQAKSHIYGHLSWENDYEQITGYLKQAESYLDDADRVGVYTEPFRKFVAECDVYANLMYATKMLPVLEGRIMSVDSEDISQVTRINAAVVKAQDKLKALGGRQEHLDRIKDLVINHQKLELPESLPKFISKYYKERKRIVEGIKERGIGSKRDPKLLATAVKPAEDVAADNVANTASDKKSPGGYAKK